MLWQGREIVSCSQRRQGQSWWNRIPSNWLCTAMASSCLTALSAPIMSRAHRWAHWAKMKPFKADAAHSELSFLWIFAAMHARSDGWVPTIWASREISRWRPFWGLQLFASRCINLKNCFLYLNPFFSGCSGSRQTAWGIHLEETKQEVSRCRASYLWWCICSMVQPSH